MRKIISLVIIFLIFTASIAPVGDRSANLSPESEFVLVKKSGGITLYEKWNTGPNNEKSREIKAVFEVRATIDEIRSLLHHEPSGTRWNKNSQEYKITPEKENWICYIEYDLPWPVSNQDCVLKFIETQTSERVIFQFNSVEHATYPLKSGVSRIEGVRGKWVLTNIHDKVQVEYFISSKPNKSLPRWITDPIIRGNLIKGMIEFRNLVEK